ncbi:MULTISPECIES: enoyl-CoA hydratase/isomerase family protein [unclassified Pseudofrankia]|uniref:enoyl-CoA hydratase/isomerase family protein n=1 Tax=unclassified Pseudofrankia TaxID=2994372 RepID=UPI0008DB131F|nr:MULTISPECIES: enoyl-CoA hydratase/isomerase family protein [unclassified Pseudofrankia]MDT3441953.1 enoyl-CoA hydratase/isomerase family protein [Pseudofrankia sp. BMG5.37]OHV44636.1 enoyl-CoA hydratase [Pseudofrankia sp. BMG5.36]
MTQPSVRLHVAGGVGTIRLDRPPVNALDAEMRTRLAAAAAEAGRRGDVRAVVVYGGERSFAAGADVRELAAADLAGMVADVGELQATLGAVAGIGKPTIAALTGFALGGGLEIALACDFRMAAQDVRLGLPEVLLGTIPCGGGTQRLARLVGPAVAKDLLYTGRQVRADEALATGLVDAVLPVGEVYQAALARAAAFATGPALALRALKLAVDEGLEVPLDTGLAIERAHFIGLFATEDRAEGMASFLQRGPGKAVFTGC